MDQNKQIPVESVGNFIFDPNTDWYYGPKYSIHLPNKKAVQVNLVSNEEDLTRESEICQVLSRLATDCEAIFKASEKDIYEYYLDMKGLYGDEVDYPQILNLCDIWDNVVIGADAMISFRAGDNCMYISLECECSWEEEHGLQIVIKDGVKIVKVGPFDGHLTNADAFNNAKLERVVYCGSNQLEAQ